MGDIGKVVPPIRRSFRRLLHVGSAIAPCSTLSAIAFLAAATTQAHADCAPTTAPPLTNGGTITCTGSVNSTLTLAPPGITDLSVNIDRANFNASPSIQGGSMQSLTVTNDGGNIQAVSLSMITALTFTNSGNFNGAFSASNIGTMSFVNSGNTNTTTFSDIGNLTITNSGNMSGGLTVSGAGNHTVINSGNINLSLLTSSGNDTINNFGHINSGINAGQINKSGGNLTVNNFPGATINSGILHTGSGRTVITNEADARIQGPSILLGDGNDLIVNRGTINSNIDQGNGDDTFLMLLGTVNANIVQGSGRDSTQINGGTINGTLAAGGDTDSLIWNGGLINGIDMGSGDDSAQFNNLTQTQLRSIPIDGGLGNDRLFWAGTQGETLGRLLNWELIQLGQFSRLTMSQNDNLTLGDSGTLTGALSVLSSSTLFAGNGPHAIQPAVPGNLVSVINAGTIDLTNGAAAATDVLTIIGNYQGQNGLLNLHTVLGDDSSLSDRLVISGVGATTSGSTGIGINNLNGPGALTLQNGILVVEGLNGATTGAGTFALAGRAAAGAYEYFLFRGGITADPATDSNWYLRNVVPSGICPTSGVAVDCGALAVIPPTTVPPPPPTGGGGGNGGGGSDLVGGGGGNDGGGGGNGGGDGNGGGAGGGAGSPPNFGVILYRPEVALDSVVPALARMGVMTLLGTFHEREGEQLYASADGVLHKGWARAFGGQFDRSWYGSVLPSADGSVFGFQAGLPLLGWNHDNGHRDRIGFFAGYGKVLADVGGYALGRLNVDVGRVNIDMPSVGAYWTHFAPGGGYIDAVIMGSFVDQATQSSFGVGQRNSGSIVTASIEAGQPFALGRAWSIEPQAQFIIQHQQFDGFFDRFSSVSFEADTIYTARVGARLAGDFLWESTRVKPYLLANVWHEFEGDEIVHFANTPILNKRGATSVEIALGGSAAITQNVALYARVSHTTSLDDVVDSEQRFTSGKLGLQFRF